MKRKDEISVPNFTLDGQLGIHDDKQPIITKTVHIKSYKRVVNFNRRDFMRIGVAIGTVAIANLTGCVGDSEGDNDKKSDYGSDKSSKYLSIAHDGSINSLAFSNLGVLASASDDKTVKLWNVSNKDNVKLIFTYKGHSDKVSSVAFKPSPPSGESQLIFASGSYDRSVQIWNGNSGSVLLKYYGHTAPVKAVACSPDGNLIASGGDDNSVQVWNALTGQQVLIYTGHSASVNAVAFSPKGDLIASGGDDNSVQVWNALTGQQVLIYTGHSASVNAVAFSPEGRNIASGSSDATIHIWIVPSQVSVQASTIIIVRVHTASVNACAFSPDGSQLASGSSDKTVCISASSTGGLISRNNMHSEEINAVVYSRINEVFSGDSGGVIYVSSNRIGDKKTCTCDTVCTCDKVCTCDTVGGGNTICTCDLIYY